MPRGSSREKLFSAARGSASQGIQTSTVKFTCDLNRDLRPHVPNAGWAQPEENLSVTTTAGHFFLPADFAAHCIVECYGTGEE